MWDSPYKSSWSATGHKKNLAKGNALLVAMDKSMVALKWGDKCVSTLHDDSMVTKTRQTGLVEGGREEVRKPVMVKQYNKCDRPRENKVGKIDFEIWAQTAQMDFFSILRFCT